MIPRIMAIPSRLWLLLGLVAALPLFAVYAQYGDGISPTLFLYVVQPILTTAIAVVSYIFIGGSRVRIRHALEKALLIGAIIAVWFVVYFLSGLVLTYVRNSLVVGVWPTIINVAVYSITAFGLEYVRYKLVAAVGKRHVLWFGVVVSIVFAIVVLPYGQIAAVGNIEQLIKVFIATILPAIAASFLLTYLALTSGLAAMLVYRLGMVAIAILPPIIPNYDWYLIGISSLLVSMTTYLLVDRQLQHQLTPKRHQLQHIKHANDIMFVAVLIGVAAFMSGFFSYRPLAIVSNSMQPVYSRGAIVVVERVTDPMDIKLGDIVQYESTGKTITHRVVAIDAASDGSGKRVFTTKGDNSPSNDPIVAARQINGIIRAQIPYVGYPTIWLREMAR